MTREEFCAILHEERKKSGVKNIEICTAMSMMWPRIVLIEKAKHNFAVHTLLAYLEAINRRLVMITHGERIVFTDTNHIVSWLIAKRKANKIGQVSLSALTGYSRSAISIVEIGLNALTIDYLLKTCEALNVSVTIESVK